MKRSLQFTVYSLLLVTGWWLVVSAKGFAQEKPSSKELLIKAWEAHGKGDVEDTFKITNKCIELYKEEAERQSLLLKDFSKTSEIEKFSIYNDVATCYFIQAESYMRQQKFPEAKDIFNLIIKKYPFSQAWDPRGWYWKIAEVSKESIKKIDEEILGIAEISKEKPSPKTDQPLVEKEIIKTEVKLKDLGTEEIVDYARYGKFHNIGEKDYRYEILNQEELSEAVGEGIWPNTTSVRWNPEFRKLQKEGRLKQSHWELLNSEDLEAAFFKWALYPELKGVSQFYIGLILERSGLIKHALKAYYSILVHFPTSYGWTYWHTPWYIGQAAIGRINFLLRKHPELGLRLVDAKIRIINGFDNDLKNDIFIVNPGRFVKINTFEKIKNKFKVQSSKLKVKEKVGDGEIRLVQYENDHWQLLVDDKPYIIKGITYSPTKVGQSPDEGTLGNWMEEDFNQNGKIDGPYDSFIDKNRNNIQDEDEIPIGDFQLMKEMGVNTIRIYHHPKKVNKELLRDLYKNYGIRVIMGDFLGKYALGSNASWYEGTDYNNKIHRRNMIKSITEMVLEYKDEPYILFWLLGNENVYGVACNADKDPESFFRFANLAAKWIKRIDKNHPVAICSGDLLYFDKFARLCPDIDIFGTNAYRGESGFGYFWQAIKDEKDIPVFITEYGCPAYAEGRSEEEVEEFQAEYHFNSWKDIEYNMAFSEGEGNSIGGVIFEFLDEWWKAYEPYKHDFKPLWAGPFPDGYMHEEWLGVCRQGDGKLSPFLRQLRKSYYTYKEIWKPQNR